MTDPAPDQKPAAPGERRPVAMTPYAIAVALFAAFVVGGILAKVVPLWLVAVLGLAVAAAVFIGAGVHADRLRLPALVPVAADHVVTGLLPHAARPTSPSPPARSECEAKVPARQEDRPLGGGDHPRESLNRLLIEEPVMGIVAWIVLGLVAGLIANMLIPGRRSQGLILTCVIGVAGALGGGWAATKLFHIHSLQGFFNLSTWLTAIAGAAVLLLVFHLVSGRSSHSRRSGRFAHR
jgi:uncharacterized membrane protein YeaQ/YmgE (transglycosylase-associated protein family)